MASEDVWCWKDSFCKIVKLKLGPIMGDNLILCAQQEMTINSIYWIVSRLFSGNVDQRVFVGVARLPIHDAMSTYFLAHGVSYAREKYQKESEEIAKTLYDVFTAMASSREHVGFNLQAEIARACVTVMKEAGAASIYFETGLNVTIMPLFDNDQLEFFYVNSPYVDYTLEV